MSILGRMETPEAVGQSIDREQQLRARFQLATIRLNDTQQERVWAMVAAHEAGPSSQQIAATAGLSPNRVHQLRTADEAQESPVWLSQFLRTVQLRLAEERGISAGVAAGTAGVW